LQQFVMGDQAMMFSVTQRLAIAIALVGFAATLGSGAARATTSTPAVTDPCSVPLVGTPATGQPGAGMQMGQEFDLMFIDMMIPHHESAIAMAQVALARAEHEELRMLAQEIIAGQQAEIDRMTAWRDAWYPGAPAMPMDQMGQLMGGMIGTPGAGMGIMGDMMGTMDTAAEVQALCSAGGPFDLAFLQMMIPHHQSAVLMAQVALQRATHPELKQLAQAIVDAQEQEIGEMEGWLTAWYGATPTS
jgi:uncharacterized protein (DUF305 family)